MRRSSNLRPRTGVVAIVSSFMVVLEGVALVLMMSEPVTVMISSAVEISSVGRRVIVWPTVRVSPSCTSVAKPDRVNVTVYDPEGICRKRNRPSESEAIDRVMRVHAAHCPVYRSLHPQIRITTSLELATA